MRQLTFALALPGLLACAAAPPPADPQVATAPAAAAAVPLDRLAERYVALALALGEHDEDYVDAYFGPPEARQGAAAAGASLDEIRDRAAVLLADLAVLPQPTERLDRLRRDYLASQTEALAGRLDLLAGRRRPFDEESRLLYGAVAPHHDREHYEALLAELETAIPGEGELSARMEAYREGFVIPTERLHEVFQLAIAACRERTGRHLRLPAGERFTVGYVTDKPWSGYNWYQGDFESLIEVNTDLPITVDRAVDLACHEGYPGHHAYNVVREQRLVRQRGWVEHTVVPLFAPQALIMEGSANFGIDMAFPREERLAFEREVIFPAAGLDPATAAGWQRVLELQQRLAYADNDAARQYLDGEIDAAATAAWLERYRLMSPERAAQRVRFIDRYRSYVINYNLGRDLVAAWVEAEAARAGGGAEARWAAFERLLAEPLLPGDLVAGSDE